MYYPIMEVMAAMAAMEEVTAVTVVVTGVTVEEMEEATVEEMEEATAAVTGEINHPHKGPLDELRYILEYYNLLSLSIVVKSIVL